MEYLKKNIRIVIFIVLFIVIIFIFNNIINREVNYETEYDVSGYHINEIYNKDDNKYLFKVQNDNHYYEIAVDHKYTNRRKLVKYVDKIDNNDFECVSINVYNTNSNFICNKDNEYFDNNMGKTNESSKSRDVNNVGIYSDRYDYVMWNGYGVTYLNKEKENKFLTNESYTNELAYQYNGYLLIADYDSQRVFNKFYIYNNKKKDVSSWDIPYEISFDSYFLGHIGDDVYLFDTSSKLEYRINIKKKKIKIISKDDMAVFYNGKKEQIPISNLVYNMKLFNYNSLFNFSIEGGKLYYKYYNSNKLIKISDRDIKDIVYFDDNSVYYISDTSLYSYNVNDGETKLLDSFEWNFNYHNQIYVFER